MHGRAVELAGKDAMAMEEGNQAAGVDMKGDGRRERERDGFVRLEV